MAISHVPRYLRRVNNQQAIKCLRVTLGKSLPISGPQFVYLELESLESAGDSAAQGVNIQEHDKA